MFINRFPIFFTLAVAITGVSAQSSNDTLDNCGLACVNATVAASPCLSPTNLTCVCTNTQFQDALTLCLKGNCSALDFADAQELQKQACANVTNPTDSGN